MDNILLYQVKSIVEKFFACFKISGRATSGRFVIVQMDNGEDPLNLEEVKAFGRLLSGGNEIRIKKLQGSMDLFIGLQRI